MGMRQRQAVPSPNAAQRVLEPTGQVRMAYVEPTDLSRWLATSGMSPLAIVSFGCSVPGAFPCPIVELDLPQLDGPRQCEVWNCDQPVRFYTRRNFSAAMSRDILFGSI